MSEYPNVGSGLRLMFTARIGVIACMVVALIPVIRIFAVIGALVFFVLDLVGLHRAGRDLPGCQNAFWLSIISLVIGLFKNTPGFLGTVLNFATDILSLVVVYFVISSVNEVLQEIGYGDIARTGSMVWKIQLTCFIVGTVLSILVWVSVLDILAILTAFGILILTCIEGILFLYYLYKSYMALE